MRGLSLAIAVAVAILVAPAAMSAGTLEERIDQVGQKIVEADDMFRSAMKGHLPSLEVINALRARMTLARDLFKEAKTEAAEGKEYQAGAKLDAAEYLAERVFEASEH